MKNATRMDIRQMVTEMEVRSDEIVQELVITGDAVEALKKIKKTIARTHTLVDAMSEEMQEQYSPVLTRILSYVQQAVSYPEAVELYAERICDHVDNYLLLHRHYDAEYEQGKDRETASFIEIKRAALRIEEITQAKNMLIEQKIQGAYPTGSADYQIMVARFDHLDE